VEIFNEFAASVHKAANLFIATDDPITLGAWKRSAPPTGRPPPTPHGRA